MKKNVRTILGGLFAVALLAGFVSCSNSTGSDDADAGTGSGKGGVQIVLSKTSILSGIQAGNDVWGSGTTTTQNTDGTYNVVAAGVGQGGWGGNIAAIPVCFGAGDLTGYSHIVLEADLSNFTLNEDNDDYPPIELKLANDNDSKAKIFNATKLFANEKAEIDISSVNFLDEVTKIQFAIRGSGSIILKDISKVKTE